MYRTHTCNELSDADIGSSVQLSGWVYRRRDHGGLIFFDLRDRYGLAQIVFDPANNEELFNNAEQIRDEFVVTIEGTVRSRPEGQENPRLSTGKIEVLANTLTIINRCKQLPFVIDQDLDVGEDIRLKYRFLDLRRERMQNNIITRYKAIKFIRDFLDERQFLEIETPMMIKNTPEGSREYLVPSRMHPGSFYVLPQSPQQLKQLLMVAGFDKYFQIARCFRDEDLRGDRQPEFTQLDLEMSFVAEEDVMQVNEELVLALLNEFCPEAEVREKVARITWEDAMNTYGSDKPDLRFDLPITDVSDLVADCDFQVFTSTIKNGGVIKALRVPGGGAYSRTDIAAFEDTAKIYGAKGLAYLKHGENGLESTIAKFFSAEILQQLAERTESQPGDCIFFMAAGFHTACTALGAVRLSVAKREQMIPENTFAVCWVTDFPLFEKNADTGEIGASHHPFTAPHQEDIEKLEQNPLSVKSRAYDLVVNGVEVAGGSIRIHDRTLQNKVFTALNISEADQEARFGHILHAFEYGAPPHGGIAWGLDRLIMLLQGEPNIREVICFPKDQRARDLMLEAPSAVDESALTELGIRLIDEQDA